VVWLLLVVAWLGAAADGTVRIKNYDIWKDLPTKQLCDLGRRYFDDNNVDSALVCYTIVANRYYSTPRSDKEEFRRIGVALNTGLTPNAYRKQRATQPPADSPD